MKFIDESTVLGYSPRDLNVRTYDGENRSGWIFQQLLKLSGAIGDSMWFIVIDADHILINPHTFVDRRRRHVMYLSDEFVFPYYQSMHRILGYRLIAPMSYVAHKMVFNREILAAFQNHIEVHLKNKVSWDKVILENIDLEYTSSFSEFECYGHFVPKRYKITQPWRQIAFKDWETLPTYEELKEGFGDRYLSVTFPEYLRKKM